MARDVTVVESNAAEKTRRKIEPRETERAEERPEEGVRIFFSADGQLLGGTGGQRGDPRGLISHFNLAWRSEV